MTLWKTAPRLRTVLRLFSDEGRTRKAYLNALASSVDYGAQVLVAFFTIPWLVGGLGDYAYGMWQVLNRLVGYISPASGRPNLALKWTIANQQGSADYALKRSHVGSAIAAWMLFLPIMGVAGGVLAWFAPHWLGTPPALFLQARVTTGVLVANLAMTSVAAIPRSVLQGENLGYKRLGLSAVLVFVGGGLTLLALHLRTGLVGVAGAALVGTLLYGLLYLFAVRAYAPWFGVARPSWQAIRSYLGLSWWYLAWDLVLSLMTASDVIVLGLLNSVESVTAYTLTKYAPEMMISLVAIVVFGIVPGLGGIIGSGEIKKAAQVRSEIMSLTWLVAAAIGSSVLLWNRTFIGLWVGADRFAGSIPSLLVVVGVTQFVLIRTDATIIDLTLRPQHKVYIGGLSVALALAAAAVLVGYFRLGIVGLTLGLIAGRSIITIGYPAIIGRFLQVPLSSQLKGALRPTVAAAVLFVLASGLGRLIPTEALAGARGWAIFFVAAGATCGLAAAMAFFAGLTAPQRKNVLRRLRFVLAATSS